MAGECQWKHVAKAVHIMVDDEAHGEIGWLRIIYPQGARSPSPMT